MSAADVNMEIPVLKWSLKSGILHSTSFQLDITFLIALGHGKFGPGRLSSESLQHKQTKIYKYKIIDTKLNQFNSISFEYSTSIARSSNQSIKSVFYKQKNLLPSATCPSMIMQFQSPPKHSLGPLMPRGLTPGTRNVALFMWHSSIDG